MLIKFLKVVFSIVLFCFIWTILFPSKPNTTTIAQKEGKKQKYGFNVDDVCIEIKEKFAFDKECLHDFKIYMNSWGDYNCYRRNWIVMYLNPDQPKRLWLEYAKTINPYLTLCVERYYDKVDVSNYVNVLVECTINMETNSDPYFPSVSYARELYNKLNSFKAGIIHFEKNEEEVKRLEIESLKTQVSPPLEKATKIITAWQDLFIQECLKNSTFDSCKCLETEILNHFPNDLLAKLVMYRTDILDYLKIIIGPEKFKEIIFSCNK